MSRYNLPIPELVSRRNTLAMLSSTAILAACGGDGGGSP